MGKKRKPSGEGEEEEAQPAGAGEGEPRPPTPIASLTSLFSSTNPFRRGPHTPAAAAATAALESPRKHTIPTPAPDSDLSVRKKKKKATAEIVSREEEDEVVGKEHERNENRKKRKRDEIEFEYERRKYGNPNPMEENGGEKVAVGRKRKKPEVEDAAGGRGGDDSSKPRGEAEVLPSFDDEGKLLRTIFVGNLPLKTKRKAVLKEFSAFGEIESVRIRSVPIAPDTKTSRKAAAIKGKMNEAIDSVHAYIVFKDEQSARVALAHNMAKFGGNHIRVDMACPPRKKMKGEAPIYSVKKTVFVGNLPFDVKDEELYQLFCVEHQLESSLEAVRVIRDPQTSLGKGIAYIMFKTREAANAVVKKKGIKLRDRELRLSHAKSDPTPSKRKIENHGAAEYPQKRKPNSSGQAEQQPKVRASSLSYEGVRSSKLGMPKKAPRVNRPAVVDSGGKKQSGGKKIKSQKRPAVAARKANAQKQAQAQAQAQKKRKLDNRTPESLHRSKKARRFS